MRSAFIASGVNPERSPAYPLPPWTHKDASTLQVICRTEHSDALDAWVPSPLRRRGDGIFALVVMDLPHIAELGPQYHSREAGLVVPVIHEESGRQGSTWAAMFVDNDIAQIAGREVWGHPKKLADVEVELGVERSSGAVHQLGYRDANCGLVFSVEADLDGSHGETAELAFDLGPRIQKRVLPSPFGLEPDLPQLVRVIVSNVVISSRQTGTARIELAQGPEGLDELLPVDVLGAYYQVADFVLRFGKPLDVANPDKGRFTGNDEPRKPLQPRPSA